MLNAGAKRFYKKAEVQAASSSPLGKEIRGFEIVLDGRPVKAPGGNLLVVPGEALATAIRREWEDQEDTIRPQTMPLTQIAFTAIDKVAPEHEQIARNIAKYAETDLLCYRSDAPADLVAAQEAAWQPLLDWAETTFSAPLTVTSGIIPEDQPAASLSALADHVADQDIWRLTVLASVTQTAGSLIVGLALLQREIDAEAAVAVSQLDESHQTERWGQDKEALERQRALSDEIRSASRFLDLLDGRTPDDASTAERG